MLGTDAAVVTGGASLEQGCVVRVLHGALSAVAVVGRPPPSVIAAAVDGTTPMTPVLTHAENAAHVGESLAHTGAVWRPERAILHRLPDTARGAAAGADPSVRLLRADDPLDHLPPEVRFEMTHARAVAPMAVVVVDGRPVSFCYPVWRTETLWDVSIDTLEGYRGRHLAERAVWFMVAAMRSTGREPVWGALESNAPSLTLARRLGFTAVDEQIVFARGPWAYFTAGFVPQGG